MKCPQKRNYRQRAHCNPFSDHDIVYPLSPSLIEQPQMVDIGCGYGGLLFALSRVFPAKKILGMEIRKKLVEYVRLKIKYMQEKEGAEKYKLSVVRTNSMKFLPNYLEKDTVEKMFILFPDPHFKKKKHKARIVSSVMLDIYQYVLKPKGLLYIATDVEELYISMLETINAHSLFRRLPEEREKKDSLWDIIIESTEEAHKVDTKCSKKYRAIFENIS